MEMNRFEEAEKVLKKAVPLDPNNSKVHFNLGVSLEAQGKIPEAIDAYREVLRCDATHIGAYNNLASLLKSEEKEHEIKALYEEAIKRCRSAGVIFHASLIFGLDEDTPHVFERTLEFLLRHSVPSISPCILTPYPGTPLFKRLMRERRILHTNWSYYDHTTVCYQPKHMDPEELAEKYLEFRNRFFSHSSFIQRAYAQLRVAPFVYFGANLVYRKTTRLMKEHFRNYFNWLRQHKENSIP